jgi:hypothetical protein
LLGEFTTDTSVHSVVDTYMWGSGLTGSPQDIAPGSNQLGIGLDSISCPDAMHCVAVGGQSGQIAEVATFVEMNSGVWGNPVVVSNPKDGTPTNEFLSSVDCPDFLDCVAAGNWLDNNANGFVDVYTKSGGAWGKNSPVDIALPSNLNEPFADDISCVASINLCTLVGALSDSSGGLHAASAQMTGGKWGQLAAAAPASGTIPDSELLAVSCATGVQCTAVGYANASSNDGGRVATDATWVPAGTPSHVTNLHGVATSSQSVHLSWTAPLNFGSGQSHYEVTAILPGKSNIDEGPFLGTSAMISKLSAGGAYHFIVTTVATDGQTSAGEQLTITLPATVPGAPKLMRVISMPHELKAIWAPPTSTGGKPITSYTVNAKCGSVTHSSRFGGAARQGGVGGLPSGMNCTVRVSAANKVGRGPSSTPLAGRPG